MINKGDLIVLLAIYIINTIDFAISKIMPNSKEHIIRVDSKSFHEEVENGNLKKGHDR